MTKAIVLLSGGQDSATCLAWALEKGYECIALSLFYGQRHASELDAARAVALGFGVEHVVESFPVLANIGGSALVGDGTLAAAGGYEDEQAEGGLPTSFVPGRNLLFLGLAGALAVKHGAKVIVTGVCQTDYSGYPDCRAPFISAMTMALNQAMPSESGPFEIQTPLMNLTKAATVLMAYDLPGAWEALAHTITCYNGIKGGCPQGCPACDLRAKGFAEAQLEDPAA